VTYTVPPKPRPPKTRLIATNDPAEQVALAESTLQSPIGGWHDGKFYATADSLAQARGAPYKVKA
jgi:hypothetical protein